MTHIPVELCQKHYLTTYLGRATSFVKWLPCGQLGLQIYIEPWACIETNVKENDWKLLLCHQVISTQSAITSKLKFILKVYFLNFFLQKLVE